MTDYLANNRPEFPGAKGPIPDERKIAPKFIFDDQVLHSTYKNFSDSNIEGDDRRRITEIYEAFKVSVDLINNSLRSKSNYFPYNFAKIVGDLTEATKPDFDQANFFRIGICGEAFIEYSKSVSAEIGNDIEDITPELLLIRNSSDLVYSLLRHIPAWRQFKLEAQSHVLSEDINIATNEATDNVVERLAEFADFVDPSVYEAFEDLKKLPESNENKSELILARVKSLENLVITLAKHTYNKSLVHYNQIESPNQEKWIAGNTIRGILRESLGRFTTLVDSSISILVGWIIKLRKIF